MKRLTDRDLSTLSNICTTAAIRFREIAEIMRAEPGHARVGQLFDQQAAEADMFASIFAEAEEGRVS